MKKLFLLMALAVWAAVSGFADEAKTCGGAAPAGCPSRTAVPEYSVLEIGLLPAVPEFKSNQIIDGFKLGAPVSTGAATVHGVDAGFFAAGSARVAGVQAAGVAAWADTVAGLQIAPVTVADRCDGPQIGVVNIARRGAVQIGLLNYIADSPLPWMVLFNVYF